MYKLIVYRLTLCMVCNFSYFCCHLLTFFKTNFFKKNSLRTSIRVPNSLNPDQDQHSVGPDLGPYCLQRLLADDKSRHWQRKSYFRFGDLRIFKVDI